MNNWSLSVNALTRVGVCFKRSGEKPVKVIQISSIGFSPPPKNCKFFFREKFKILFFILYYREMKYWSCYKMYDDHQADPLGSKCG